MTKPNWQPLSQLPLFASVISELAQNTEEQYETLLEARDKPYVLDDALVARVFRVYETQLEDIELFEQQLERWQKQKLTGRQRQEIESLSQQLARTRAVTEAIIALAHRLKEPRMKRGFTRTL